MALTFDDGPDVAWTPRLLDALDRADAPATFFVVAARAADAPAVVDEVRRRGHGVELHCDAHVRHTDLSEADVRRDVERALELLATVDVAPDLWRTPWGVHADHTSRVAREFGLGLVGWDVDTHDWRGDDAPSMLTRIDDGLAAGGVVLAHDGIGPGARRTDCRETIALVGPLARRVRGRDGALCRLDGRGRPA